ncbi:hypothetical protein BH721_01685 [Clostridium baratii]|uniref:hypothetical protein n=1 Tax=Clostridium baratii TaxID=1561 RepID=UPI0009A25F99|nr:hypothetical protein [Clostridium baratii]OPF51486.1 hypothetical protein A1M12_02790 [Clostridium baratii]OPF55443.1 hypothetical protein BH721_01685 [Clostridium baratii]OPF57726.1 hypothetical protein BH724_08940 [Clostridium baratii]OPF60176.1 hypothetical protein BH725_06240 [Clostridium baratii]
MYIVFGNKIMDTSEMKERIEENTAFKVIKDMSKGTKREDVCAFNLSINIEALKEELEGFDIEGLDEDTLFDEYLAVSEEAAMEIEEYLPEESKVRFVSYKWDLSDNDIKGIIVIGNEEISDVKMSDVLRRLLTQVE